MEPYSNDQLTDNYNDKAAHKSIVSKEPTQRHEFQIMKIRMANINNTVTPPFAIQGMFNNYNHYYSL